MTEAVADVMVSETICCYAAVTQHYIEFASGWNLYDDGRDRAHPSLPGNLLSPVMMMPSELHCPETIVAQASPASLRTGRRIRARALHRQSSSSMSAGEASVRIGHAEHRKREQSFRNSICRDDRHRRIRREHGVQSALVHNWR